MIDEPERRAEIHDGLADVFEAMTAAANPISVKTALNLAGIEVGGFRLPIVEADEHEREVVRALAERRGLLQVATA